MAKEVSLVEGERVQLALEAVTFDVQTFVRLSPNLILGLVRSPLVTPRVYLWREQEGVYQYEGDIVFASSSTGGLITPLVYGFPPK